MKRKLFSVLSLILVMTLVLAACGTKTPPPASPSPSEPATQSPEPSGEPQGEEVELPGFHIGLMVYTNSGAWFDRIKAGVDALANATGCTITLADGSTPDEAIAAVENLCAAGVDGIVDLATGGVSARLLQICEENGVYFVAANNNLLNEEGYETFRKNPYYVGSVYADDKQISYDIVKDMIAKGASKIALFGLPPGISAAFDSRFAGAYEALAEANIQVLTEARSFVMPEAAQNLLTQYPDVEAIFSAVNASNYLFQPLMAGGYGGKVMLNLFDDDGDVATGFSQGIVSHAVEGVNAQAQFAFIMLYNALTEHKMTMSDGSAPDILMPYLLLTSADEYNAFLERAEGGIYSWDELKEFVALVNPNASLDDMIALAQSFSK
ncbi:MAG TPA: substrate-binding domain-containing protein [Papillibacter sp.]|jgi:ABC-type sugar transport system substrate-binding protein|nr:substrate-binding domain-containing protein [Papillibacter sp.]